jgi:hypothetical protein
MTLGDEISDGDFVPQKVRELVAELERLATMQGITRPAP